MLKHALSRFAPLAFALLLPFACGDDKSEPEQKCDAFGAALCTKVRSCGQESAAMDRCVAEVSEELMCPKAKAVSSTYDKCLQDVAAATCPFPEDLPASCRAVILQ